MKKLFSFLAIIGIILASNCSRIPENNDPVIGIWSQNIVISNSEAKSQTTTRQEWIFNDAYLGRYHTYVNKNLDVITDFKWNHEGETYTISYPGLDKEDDIVILKESDNGTMLEYVGGNMLAKRD